jgi:hypothetical protein
MIPSGNMSFADRTLVGWMSWSWTQIGWDRLGWWPLRLRSNHFRWRPPWLGQAARALYKFPGICVTTEENHGKSQSPLPSTLTLLVAPTWLSFRDSLDRPAEHQTSLITRGFLQTVLDRHKCLPSCGFPASDNFKSKLSVSNLMRSAKNGIPKSSWICLLPTYQGALVAMRRQLGCSTCSFRTWLWPADLRMGLHIPSWDGWAACTAAPDF